MSFLSDYIATNDTKPIYYETFYLYFISDLLICFHQLIVDIASNPPIFMSLPTSLMRNYIFLVFSSCSISLWLGGVPQYLRYGKKLIT